MENLLKPDIGLIFWTFVNFAVLLLLLSKIAWKPMLKAIRRREEYIKQSVQSAELAKEQALKLHAEVEKKLKSIENKQNEIIQAALKLANSKKEKILEETKIRARQLLDEAEKDIHLERKKLFADLKKEVVEISIKAAQIVIAKKLDKKTNQKLVSGFLKNLDIKKIKNDAN